MGTASRRAAVNAINTLERPRANPATAFRKRSVTADVMRVAQALWPVKTDWALREKTGSSDRMCRYWLERKYNISADDLVALLRTDDGLKFLDALIDDAKPVWWRDFKRSVKRAELRRQQMLLAKQIDENEQAELDV